MVMATMLRVTNEETLRAVLEDWGRNLDEANAPEECGEVPDAVLPRAVEAAIASLRSGNEDERENACAALKAFDAEIARDRDRLRFQLTAERERLVHAEERHAELDALVQALCAPCALSAQSRTSEAPKNRTSLKRRCAEVPMR